ncbi:MAG: UDP-4-amino-4,6-dideoxy-N-acetyl-beta-L-altrosamine transaminase [Hydrotalea sp.]|nr:UDP-4-amino-4,6-dideoxy-N-acetyl-beta-L-altrosamine transaminase [Hydrotalea sp.]
MNKIPYSKQYIDESDIDAVKSVLTSTWLTQGPTIAEFEKKFAEYIECKYAVAVSNGTAALHLCALALGIKEGQKVITTPISFSATANCIRYCGGEVVFVDVDPETHLLDLDKVENLLKSSKPGEYSGIIPVDFAGLPVNMEKLHRIANEYGLWIIEDACHAPGGYIIDSNNKVVKCGQGKYANLAIFSFHPVKHIAAGEGGMITTNDETLYHKLRNLRSHGIQQRSELKIYDHGPWYYEMQELGYNYRLTDIQAALGISQLARQKEGMKRRIEIAKKYYESFKRQSFIIRQSGVIEGHAYHLYVVEFRRRTELYKFLATNNIITQIHYIPIHLMPYYQNLGNKKGDFAIAEEYYDNCLSLPMYPTLSDSEQQFVIDKIFEFYSKL